ncbi:acyl-CoA dehydrogenase family protein [Geodermatophilus sabuli]|uniref:Acyl-CoA dehydrogenase n=1 Tax=Geodermatophilus sabuli TaxID=1564158 RepID=A0A285E822_9ACTN|nr:acyl-CoA dehydrogenase family protein [Geodermatophilus sabuli]MBB3082879.1 alkylation response protein AidB-like acyl-CoA dehydrogenase [Geodermatophilus sabuli]SNX94256.1 Acyl-CoA dehydrogenase [Geodermatophilus sabuli]
MDFDDTPDEAAYRAAVRTLLEEHAAELLHVAPGGEAVDARTHEAGLRRTQRVLAEAGLVGITWPREHGGQGGTLVQQAIVTQELARAGVPTLINHIGLGMCGPTVIAHGSDDQKRRYLARLLRADDVWCQLFSEPASGSDLAALRTTAVRDGDEWVVNGQKVWTTLAHVADLGILLTRTDPDRPKHAGLTMFVVDMHAPGVTVRPLRQMVGSAGFNEVFFDEVRIPDEERLGEPGEGWRVAITTLMNERVTIGGAGSDLGVPVERLAALARERLPHLDAERQVLARQAVGRAVVASLAARYTGYRRFTVLSQGGLPGPEASAGKLAGTAAAKLVADAGVRLLGDDAVYAATADGDATWQRSQGYLPGLAIAGGTDQVLRNILGERVLGLPPEPRSDKDAPFAGGRR